LLERYVTADPSHPLDPDVQLFVAHHASLIRIVDVLRSSWAGTLASGAEGAPTARSATIAPRIAHSVAPVISPVMASAPKTNTVGTSAVGTWWMAVGRLGRRVQPTTAAIVVIILGLVGATIYRAHATRQDVVTTRSYATTAGQQAVVHLVDGSQITLAPGTTVRTTESSVTHAIAVAVDGEALFQVVHRSHVPFTVRTRNAMTRVLGTEFLVRQYATDRVARVVVAEGRISLASVRHQDSVAAVMGAHTMATVDDSGRIDVTPGVSTDDYTAWTTGQLVFRQAPARQIVADLSRAYGVDLRVTDSVLAQHTLSWSVPVTRVTLAGVLEALTAALDAHVVQSGNTITIVPGRVTPARPRTRDVPPMQEHTYGL